MCLTNDIHLKRMTFHLNFDEAVMRFQRWVEFQHVKCVNCTPHNQRKHLSNTDRFCILCGNFYAKSAIVGYFSYLNLKLSQRNPYFEIFSSSEKNMLSSGVHRSSREGLRGLPLGVANTIRVPGREEHEAVQKEWQVRVWGAKRQQKQTVEMACKWSAILEMVKTRSWLNSHFFSPSPIFWHHLVSFQKSTTALSKYGPVKHVEVILQDLNDVTSFVCWRGAKFSLSC